MLIFATGFEVQVTGIYNDIRGEGVAWSSNEKYSNGMRTVVRHPLARLPEPVHHGWLPGGVPVQLDRHARPAGPAHLGVHRLRPPQRPRHHRRHPDAEEWWVQEVIAHRGKTNRNRDCTPGYYNFEGEFNRRQDGNYNGTFKQYVEHMNDVRARMEDNFAFTSH